MNHLRSLLSSSKLSSLIACFSGCFVVFGYFVFLLTLSHTFFTPIIFFSVFLTGIGSIFFGTKLFVHSPSDIRAVFILSSLFIFLLAFFTVPTIFSGRDQGSISEAMYRLAQNNTLQFSFPASETFFKIHTEGTAQNFPGFAYTKTGKLITQFPLGYTSFLASFIVIFGGQGYIIGNSVLLFLSLLLFYALLRKFVHPLYAFAGLFLFSTSFILIWFTKMTLSENYALFLFLFLCFVLLSFFEEKKIFFHHLSIISASLLAFTRIEGFAIFGITLVLLFHNKYSRIFWKQHFWKNFFLPFSILLLIFIVDFITNLPYYTMIGKALFKFLHLTKQEGVVTTITSTSPSLWSLLFLYGLGMIFILGIASILFFVREKKWLLLVPTLLALPTFIYLIDPHISPDHPWMLRRFFFSLFPVLVFSAVIGIASLFSQKESFPLKSPKGKSFFFLTLLFSVLVIIQYPAFMYGFSLSENRGLKEQVLSFSETFLDTDLILVERNATGNGFAMMTGVAQYLTGKNFVYFFNPNDLSILDMTGYTNVYLLIPERDQLRYTLPFGNRLSFQKTVIFKTEQLENNSEKVSTLFPLFPEKIIKETRNSLYLFH